MAALHRPARSGKTPPLAPLRERSARLSHDWPQRTRELAAAIKQVRLGAHDVAEALAAIGAEHEADAPLSPAMHALIALAIAVALRSDSWMAYCADVAARQGVTREQAIEALGLAFSMADEPRLADADAVLAVFDRHGVE